MKIRLKILLLLLSMLASIAMSADAEPEKKRVAIAVQERKREKGSGKAMARLNRSAVFVVQVEKKLIDGIDKTVAYLQKTAKALPKRSPQRLQILERTLNLRMEQATYVRSEEERIYDKGWRAWDVGGRKGREPQLNNKRSVKHWKQVVSEANVLLKEYPRSKTADIVTYNLAIGLQYLGKEKESAQIFAKLIKDYPNSDVAGDAYAALGDFYFDKSDFNNAKSNYEKALRFKRSKKFLWSVFKLGWCEYNLGHYQAALKNWKMLVSQARAGGRQGLDLKDEALRDMVYAFAELKDVDGAIAYYRANGGARFIGPFLTLLAEILSDQGNYAQAINVLKRYQKVAPYGEEAPEAQKEIISLYFALSRMPDVWRELERLGAVYGVKSAWAKKNDRKLVLETQALVKDQMMYYASLTLQKAIKDDNRALNEEAKKGYLLFLKHYPKAPEVPGVKYYLADIEYYLKNFREAGRYYYEIASLGKDKAVRVDPVAKKTINMHREASVDMVRSYIQDFEPEFKVLKRQKPDFKKPRALTLRAKNYIKACAKYTEWYPEDKVRVKTCETDITKIYYHSGNKKNAILYLKNLAVKYPKGKEGPASVELLIPIVSDDKEEMLRTADNLLKVPEYREGELGAKLRSLQRGVEKESIAKEKDSLKRAKMFEAQAKKYPNDPDVDKLWYNAAVDFVRGGDIDSAMGAYFIVVKRFPKKEQAKDSLLQLAKISEKRLEFAKASEFFVLFTQNYPDAKETPGALAKSCEVLIAIRSSKALSVCTAFVNRYPDGGVIVMERMIRNAERGKQLSLMAELITKQYLPRFKLSPNQQIVAYHRIYVATKGEGALGGQAVKSMESIFSNNVNAVDGEALRYIGEIAFKRANPIISKFQEVKLEGGSVDRLAASLEKKALALKQVEDTFNQVVGTKDAYWGVAALHQMGYANELYVNSLENPPEIKGASKADVLKELAPQITERKNAAKTWYKASQDTIRKFKVYNEWSVKVLNALARIEDRTFTFDDYTVTPDILQTQVPSNLVGRLEK
ncbi:MAG: tetratricopeptide repeat protein [Oligoflexales bacterium]